MEDSEITHSTIEIDVIEDAEISLERHRTALTEMDEYWAARHQEYVANDGEDASAAQEALAIRKMIRGLLAPRLETLAKEHSDELALYLNLLIPFDSQGGLRDFLIHFFQVEDNGGALVFQERDRFERDVYVLYDVYRVKKTLEVIEALRASRNNPARRFPSVFGDEKIFQILDSLEAVLKLLFKQCLPAKHRAEILPQLTPRFIQDKSLLERREEEILYAFPHVLEKYDYRRFFFLVYFKDGLRAKVSQTEEREFRYDYLDFQIIKHEFLVHWLSNSLGDDPRKHLIYEKYSMHGKTLSQLVREKPDQEISYLRQMPSHTLNDVASEVNEELPEELQIGAIPNSEKFGIFHRLKKQLQAAVEMVRAPIEVLRKKIIHEPEIPWEEPTDPEPEPETVPEPVPEPARWEVLLLKKDQIHRPFFTESSAQFTSQLNRLKVKLGSRWKGYATFATKHLERTPEMRTIRRRTPRHEWAMPYRLRYIVPDQAPKDYLFVIGAEVKAKARGMGYQAQEAYNISPYLAFATNNPEEGFGEQMGERQIAGGIKLQEYSMELTAVSDKAMEVFEVLKKELDK